MAVQVMDSSLFTESAPGRLIRIEQPKPDWAFVPNGLPPQWEFPADLWPLLAEAKEALGTLNGIGQTLPNPELLLRPLQNREALASSSIEGTYVTPQQLLLYELDPREPTSGEDRKADWLEVFNYGRALEQGCALLADLPICNGVIREMHKTLMRGVRGRDKTPGEFRQWQVQLGSRGRFIPPPPQEVGRLMDDLEKYIHSDDHRYDPLVRVFLVHYQFEAVHPFADGNGRVGRALLALMVYQWTGHAMPWLYMSAFYERFRDEYVEDLLRVSTVGAWRPWMEFCLRGTIAQALDSIRRCHTFNRLRTEFHKRIESHAPTARSHSIVEGLFASPVVTIASLAARYDIAYHTARADVARLVAAGILAEIKDEYPRSFYAPEVMKIAYGEAESPEHPKDPS
ncbi:MAG: Fic family protein [Planctomycetia bacterium]|nr:Fic family protein [Planctomycetia bacterium]